MNKMDGDWIPATTDLPRKREVITLARETGLKRREVVGILIEFWAWAAGQTADGRIDGVFIDQLPEIIDGVKAKFWATMASPAVGWLVATETGIEVPRADRWITKGAKARLQKNRRQATWRDGLVGGPVDAQASTDETNVESTDPSTRLDKSSRENQRARAGLGQGVDQDVDGPRHGPWDVIQAWNDFASIRELTALELNPPPKRLERILELCREHPGSAWWQALLAEVDRSPWLLGKVDSWSVTFDWLIDPDHLTRVLEGTYRERKAKAAVSDEKRRDDEIAARRKKQTEALMRQEAVAQ